MHFLLLETTSITRNLMLGHVIVNLSTFLVVELVKEDKCGMGWL